MATIMKGILGRHWTVQEKIGSTLYFTNHETLADTVYYCVNNKLSYKII